MVAGSEASERNSREEEFEIRQEKILDYWEDITSKAGDVQEQVLHEILSRNASCECLHRFGLNGSTDLHAFRTTLPLIEYEDVEPDIRRLANSTIAPILTVDPPVEFLASSGTSKGLLKVFPTVEGDLERRRLADSLLRPVLNRHVSGLDQGKCLYFYFSREPTKLPNGLLCLSVLSSLYRSSIFKQRPYDPSYVLTSPDEVILCTDSDQAMYCHLLLGLLQSQEVLRIGAVMASSLVRVVRYLEEVWQELCQDIATGEVSQTRVTDPAVRDACGKVFKMPNPDLAAQVGAACEGGMWAGIILRLWPNTKLIDVVATGSMEAYVPTLEMYGGGIKIVSGQLYASSECHLGVNMNPLNTPDATSYTLIPTNAYYEFIPVSLITKGPLENLAAVRLVDVQVGHDYELVITNYAGLYRYRMGDILRCTGHYNKAPEFYFVRRANATLSVEYDKTTERELHFAVTQACEHLQEVGMHLRDYSSYCDMTSLPGHYVILWELSEKEPKLGCELLDRCCSTMESNFNCVYSSGRMEKVIGPLELKIVEGGAFDELADFAISRGSSFAQYKPPRCLKQQAMVDLLNSRVVQAHFSTSMPVPDFNPPTAVLTSLRAAEDVQGKSTTCTL